MKKAMIALGLSAIVVLATVNLYRLLSRPTVEVRLENVGGSILAKDATLAQEMDAALEIPVEQTAPGPDCLASWNKTLNAKQALWLEEALNSGVVHSGACEPAEWESLRRHISKTEATCVPTAADRRPCRALLVIYRAKLADGLTLDQRNYSDMPLALLISKLYAQTVLDQTDTPRPLSELLTMAEALLARRQNWFPGLKLIAVAFYTRELNEPDDELKAQVSARLTETLERARSLVSNDPVLFEIDRRRQDSEEEPVDLATPFLPPSILDW